MNRLSRSGRRTADRGSISGFVVVITLTVLVCAGLAVDGARIVGAKVSAADHAENAARVGAQELESVRSGELILDRAGAQGAAESYLASQGVSGTVTVTPEQITVTVSTTVDMTLLGLIGVTSKHVVATRSSAPVSQ